MIRFVVAPDETIVPDLKANLPGRGAWITADRAKVALACKKGLFSRAFARNIVSDPALVELTEKLLGDMAVQALAMANKAGMLLTGFAKVDSAIRNGEVMLLIHSNDSSPDGRRKLSSAISATVALGGPETEICPPLSEAQIGRALGNNNVVHIAIKHGGIGESVRQQMKRYNNFKET